MKVILLLAFCAVASAEFLHVSENFFSPDGTFEQKICPTSSCTTGCQTHKFPTDTCLRVTGGGSAKVTCSPPNLVIEFYGNMDCSGTARKESEPLNKCLRDTSGSYLENICS
eukprot:NODE_2861_length_490_cov_93.991736_g2811_i0.p1 GENE.NODE_2861_length_490_cov_93.991736_g2811_i0~~NODE_2861_length_490_cov_93.991736_g2811_i0.p1  ORF type:complete len:112 (-),score=33.83 NODE_2861_length_490_cov_93.991736_g2811_i0:72-407(-)